MPRPIADHRAEHVAIGERVRRARVLRRVSQEALAAALNLTFQQVQKYEKGINRVPAATLVAIAEALETDIGFFLPMAAPPGRAELAAVRADLADALAAFDGTIADLDRQIDEMRRLRDLLGGHAERLTAAPLADVLEDAA